MFQPAKPSDFKDNTKAIQQEILQVFNNLIHEQYYASQSRTYISYDDICEKCQTTEAKLFVNNYKHSPNLNESFDIFKDWDLTHFYGDYGRILILPKTEESIT